MYYIYRTWYEFRIGTIERKATNHGLTAVTVVSYGRIYYP